MGKAAAAGFVAGAVGAATFGAGTAVMGGGFAATVGAGMAVMGGGFAATVGAGMISGVTAGQAGRAADNVVNRRAITSGLGNVRDMGRDALVGGISAGTGHVVLHARLQTITNRVSAQLAKNPSRAANFLSKAEYAAGRKSASIARLQYGNAIERGVAQQIRQSRIDRLLFRHVSRPGVRTPDFVGRGPFRNLKFDITTAAQRNAHRTRSYGRGLQIITYQRPWWFTVFK